MTEIRIADRLWCRGCVYAAPWAPKFTHLCDYCIVTGKCRGCPPGVGCRERILKKKKKP